MRGHGYLSDQGRGIKLVSQSASSVSADMYDLGGMIPCEDYPPTEQSGKSQPRQDWFCAMVIYGEAREMLRVEKCFDVLTDQTDQLPG